MKFFFSSLILYVVCSVFLMGCSQKVSSKKSDNNQQALKIIKNRCINYYSGNISSIHGKFTKQAQKKLEHSTDNILKNKAHLQSLDTTISLFGENVNEIYDHILTMSIAYNCKGQKYFNDQGLISEIEKALSHTRQWIKAGANLPGNWFFWRIGIPKVLGPILLLTESHIDEELFQHSLSDLNNLLTEKPYLSGANAIWQGICHFYYALLTNDADRLGTAIDFIIPAIAVNNTMGGIVEDYSYQFHDQLLYTGGYGTGSMVVLCQCAYLAKGTSYEFPKEKIELIAKHLLQHCQWVSVDKGFDLSVIGRGNKNYKNVKSLFHSLILCSQSSTIHKKALSISAKRISKYCDNVSLQAAPISDSILQAEKFIQLKGFRYFYKSDFAVKRNEHFYVSFKMFSDKMMDYEKMHGKNNKGWNQSNGLTYFSRFKNELWERSKNIQDTYDWEHLPGTTSRLHAEPDFYGNFSQSQFVGGAGNDDDGIAAFVLIPVKGEFQAKKSFFTFSDGFVALGSDITSHEKSTDVSTTVTQWGLSDKNAPVSMSDGKNFTKEFPDSIHKNIDWIWCDSVGYIFPKKSDIHTKKDSLFYTAYFNHGVHPQQSNYEYIVLPACTKEEAQNFANKPKVEILKNSEKVHAIRDIKKDATGIVFWEKGKFEDISVNKPLIVYIKNTGEKMLLSVCNPKFEEDTLEIIIHKPCNDVMLPPEAIAETTNGKTKIRLITQNRRHYQIGIGGHEVDQPDFIDNSLYEEFDILHVESTDTTTFLTLYVPDIVKGKSPRIFIHYWLGHRVKELTSNDIEKRIDNNTIVYKWSNKEAWIKKHFTGKHNYNVLLNCGIHNVWRFFLLERDKKIEDVDYHYRF